MVKAATNIDQFNYSNSSMVQKQLNNIKTNLKDDINNANKIMNDLAEGGVFQMDNATQKMLDAMANISNIVDNYIENLDTYAVFIGENVSSDYSNLDEEVKNDFESISDAIIDATSN